MATIGSLSVKLGLVTVEWDKATQKAKQDAKQLQSAFDDLSGNVKTLYGHWKTLGGAMSLSAVGFGALLQQTLQFSDAVSDLAKGFDLSIGKTLQFRDAIQSSGGNAEGAAKILSTLFTKIEDARSGNEAAISQFEKLGISFAEISRMKPEDALNRVFQAISKIGSTYERVKAVKEMLGKQGIGVEVAAVADKLGMSTAKYDQYAKAIDKVAQVNDNLAATFDNLKIAFASMISPFTRDGVVSVDKFKAGLVALTTVAVISGLVKLAQASKLLIDVWRSGAKIQVALQALGGAKGLAMLGAGLIAYTAALKTFEMESEDAEKNTGGATGSWGDDESKESAKTDKEKQLASRRELVAAGAKVDLLKEQIDLARQEGELKIKALDMDKFAAQLQEVEIGRQREIATAANQRAQALNKENLSDGQRGLIGAEYTQQEALANEKAKQARALINAQRDKELKTISQQEELGRKMEGFESQRLDLEQRRSYMTDYAYNVAQEELATKKKIAEIEQQIIEARLKNGPGEVYDAEKSKLDEQIAAERRLSQIRKDGLEFDEYRRTSFKEGWEDATRKFSQDAQGYGKLGADAFGSAIGNMNSALDNFVRTGKLNFKSFAQSVIQDILAMMLKFQAMQLVSMGMKAMGWGGGLPMGNASAGPMTASLPGRASGGPVDSSTPYMVGEQGMELFVPRSAGTIIPNHSLAGMMGGGSTTNVTNYNIQAIDTKSFEDRILGSSKAVWAANAYGQKNIATGRGRT